MSEKDFMRKLFGTDGIRGVAHQYPMTLEVVRRLGWALGCHFRRPTECSRIVVGRDTRLSGPSLERALTDGLVSAGAEVVSVGILPTPAVAFLTRSLGASAGVVISASHNPYQDNGIKIFDADGFKLSDEVEVELEQLMASPDSAASGQAVSIDGVSLLERAGELYAEHLKSGLPSGLILAGLRLVIDCANGAAYKVGPRVLSELGADVIALAESPDGRNINEHCGALFPELVAAEVERRQADVGIALDGDADRVILTDERGRVVDGDTIMAILATRLAALGNLPANTVVATTMSNLGLERALEAKGIKLARTAVGDRYVLEAMREQGLTFGGEQSGHIIFLDRSTTGDGLAAALAVLAIMVQEDKPLSELAQVMSRWPQALVSFEVPNKVPIENLSQVGIAIAEAEKALGADSRVVVRYSGTESKAWVMVEGTNERLVKAQADRIVLALRQSLEDWS